MKTVTSIDELNDELQVLLDSYDASISLEEITDEARECLEEFTADNIENDEDPEQPFFTYMIGDDVAVFMFFDDPFQLYVFPCDEQQLIVTVERDFAMVDVDECRQFLLDDEGREPDLELGLALAKEWMGFSDEEDDDD